MNPTKAALNHFLFQSDKTNNYMSVFVNDAGQKCLFAQTGFENNGLGFFFLSAVLNLFLS